jgi:predicted GIY-YIG superfamily endonuclease
MHYVYILQSQKDPGKIYIGQTENLEKRFKQHNSFPSCAYTKSFQPWVIACYTRMARSKAMEFEIYLKSHSGRAFIKKHLI